MEQSIMSAQHLMEETLSMNATWHAPIMCFIHIWLHNGGLKDSNNISNTCCILPISINSLKSQHKVSHLHSNNVACLSGESLEKPSSFLFYWYLLIFLADWWFGFGIVYSVLCHCLIDCSVWCKNLSCLICHLK